PYDRKMGEQTGANEHSLVENPHIGFPVLIFTSLPRCPAAPLPRCPAYCPSRFATSPLTFFRLPASTPCRLPGVSLPSTRWAITGAAAATRVVRLKVEP